MLKIGFVYLQDLTYGAYKTFHVTISHIEKLTDLDFGNLSEFDPLSEIDRDEMYGQPVQREIVNLEEITL